MIQFEIAEEIRDELHKHDCGNNDFGDTEFYLDI